MTHRLTLDNYQKACGHTPISIIECMILFCYTDNQGILLGDRESKNEPWGSSFQGPGFPVGMLFPQILGIQLEVQSPAQDGVLLSRQSLFCLFPPSLWLFASSPSFLARALHTLGSANSEIQRDIWTLYTYTGCASLLTVQGFSQRGTCCTKE